MKFISTYKIRPGCVPAASRLFLSGGGPPPDGVRIIGRWHKADFNGGVAILEADDAAKIYAFAAAWSDVLDMDTTPAIEDSEAGAALAAQFGS